MAILITIRQIRELIRESVLDEARAKRGIQPTRVGGPIQQEKYDSVPYKGNEHLIDNIDLGSKNLKEVKRTVTNMIRCITHEFPVGELVYVNKTIRGMTVVNQEYMQSSPDLFEPDSGMSWVQGVVVSEPCWNQNQNTGKIWEYDPLGFYVLVEGKTEFVTIKNTVTVKKYGFKSRYL